MNLKMRIPICGIIPETEPSHTVSDTEMQEKDRGICALSPCDTAQDSGLGMLGVAFGSRMKP